MQEPTVNNEKAYKVFRGSLLSDLIQHDGVEDAPEASKPGPADDWSWWISNRVDSQGKKADDFARYCEEIIRVGKIALEVFLQATVTGPPLTWDLDDLILGSGLSKAEKDRIQSQFKLSLSVDGEAVYNLIPHVEVFALSKCLLNHKSLPQSGELIKWRLRVNTWHQRLLGGISPLLEDEIYRDLALIDIDADEELLVERAAVHILHGFDVKAREDLKLATKKRRFDFALTGRLGKRTKFQEKELSQLVVLAESAADHVQSNPDPNITPHEEITAPKKLDLDDDTILENIAFSTSENPAAESPSEKALSQTLAKLDPGNQPLLHPLDSIILLITASSITNTSPQDGLTREETLPYAERVINGGSSNWQVYTQALLVRSRIEGYKSRTIERGVLQLQALVDQIIAETKPSIADEDINDVPSTSTTLLPKIAATESAPASERLRYIHHLASPPRWKLEAELADRWVSLGALRTALEIYERLQMWAEVALCYAANDREDKARKIIRRQLYNPVVTRSTHKLLEDENDRDVGDYRVERVPLPADAPRLLCILGDLEKSPAAYERAWEVSKQRFARAQRSLAKYHQTTGDLPRANEAYVKSLKVNPQNHAVWFALGCVRLQLEDWRSAAEAFGRAVQIEDTDAESWSNLAVSLLKISDSLPQETTKEDRQSRVKESFLALKRAANLKRESFRIWQNLLSVALKIEPPQYSDIVIAQGKLIDLLGQVEGEKCVDVPVMEALLADVIRSSRDEVLAVPSTNGDRPRVGLERMVIDLIQRKITPLITSSRRLWLLTAKLAIYLERPQAALTAYEKAWRSQLNKPSWDTTLVLDSKAVWLEVVETTVDLADAYESLGERTREAGMGEGEMVAKDWRFKARSAIRSVMARTKEAWEGDEGWERLEERLAELKAT